MLKTKKILYESTKKKGNYILKEKYINSVKSYK